MPHSPRMRLLLWFMVLAALVLGIWMLWGEGWEERFTFEGSVKWLAGAGLGHWLEFAGACGAVVDGWIDPAVNIRP